MKLRWMWIAALMLLPLSVAWGQEATPDTESDFMLEFPVDPPSDVQIDAARACDVEGLAAERYPDSISAAALADQPEPETACEWAALALAYANRQGAEAGEALAAFANAVAGNPAVVFHLPVLAQFYGVALIMPSPFAGETIETVEIDYSYAGLGSVVEYSVTIEDANTDTPTVSGSLHAESSFEETPEPTDRELEGTLNAALVQALADGMADLLPINSQFTSQPCWDNYPDWTVTVTFEDGDTVKVVSNDSNVIGAGGPWQTTIDGQDYMQYSPAFLEAVLAITSVLDLPQGETAAMGCGGPPTPFEDAFPASEATPEA